jgi:hypothetical protein
MNSIEKVDAAEKVIEFAKSLGFLKAKMAIWDVNEMEYPQDSFEDMAYQVGPGETNEASIGIFLEETVIFGYESLSEDPKAFGEELVWDPQ